MKYWILVTIIIIYFSNTAMAESDNGILNIINTDNLSENVQITVVRIDNNLENIVWKGEYDKNYRNLSLSVRPGIYKIYIRQDSRTILEYNNDNIGYKIDSKDIVYINFPFKDILSDAPWRINPGKNIPITYIVKDADQWPVYIRTISVYDDDEPIGDTNGDGDTLVLVRNINRDFNEDLWYSYDYLSPSIFGDENNNVEIHVKFDLAWAFDVHNFYSVYTSPYNLPSLRNWSYGDTHDHSFYTDNAVEFGAPVRLMKIAGEVMGLDWITLTDHSFDLDQKRWADLVNDSKKYSTSIFKLYPGEEISCTVPGGIYQEYNHYLAYNLTNFIPGGEWEDGTGSNYNCSQVVSIVNNQKGFGYPAHPMEDGPFTQPWQDYSLKFTGLEIWNGEDILNLEKGLSKWKELLLKGRKMYIEAGSDAHGDLNSKLGKVRTVVLAPNKDFLYALRKGNSIMTNGPFVIFNINGTNIGNTRNVQKGTKLNLNIRWLSTPEFGSVHHIKIIKGTIGGNETSQTIYPNSYSGTNKTSVVAMQDEYYRLEAFTKDDRRAYTNPIWIKYIN